MAREKKPIEVEDGERIPFDDALKRLLNSPPQHKTSAAKKPAAKAKKKAR